MIFFGKHLIPLGGKIKVALFQRNNFLHSRKITANPMIKEAFKNF
jgi:hypothetical protein